MASRTKYDAGFGVARIRWTCGMYLPPRGLFLVETWTPGISIQSTEATKPQVTIAAQVEIWTRDDGTPTTQRLTHRGMVEVTRDRWPTVRRWARLPSRAWTTTIALDGWGGETA